MSHNSFFESLTSWLSCSSILILFIMSFCSCTFALFLSYSSWIASCFFNCVLSPFLTLAKHILNYSLSWSFFIFSILSFYNLPAGPFAGELGFGSINNANKVRIKLSRVRVGVQFWLSESTQMSPCWYTFGCQGIMSVNFTLGGEYG